MYRCKWFLLLFSSLNQLFHIYIYCIMSSNIFLGSDVLLFLVNTLLITAIYVVVFSINNIFHYLNSFKSTTTQPKKLQTTPISSMIDASCLTSHLFITYLTINFFPQPVNYKFHILTLLFNVETTSHTIQPQTSNSKHSPDLFASYNISSSSISAPPF